ncbi:hypothetical protein [Picosynechococcus sp. PCC 8807]|uniref:hypothetical protein n=1 Tax=Picosynechococcus sp. PCC 8807 TaxID=195248 RepID=UPI000810BEBB|nr:hypothetical protein [Picosynechococcus sp. PCC 8807]ANV90679.1 hypothetical protein AWQ24_08580 [Picosynechococcus sp. PCC 8807]
MDFGILITVAIASGSTVAALFQQIGAMERRLDQRLDKIELAIASQMPGLEGRIVRLENNQNQEARSARAILSQLEKLVAAVAKPVPVSFEES